MPTFGTQGRQSTRWRREERQRHHRGDVAGHDELEPGAVNEFRWAVDALDATLRNVERARAGGLTTVNIMPGSGTLMGGQTAYLKLRDGDTIDELLLCENRWEDVCGGMKMANGTNPQGGSGPDGRMGAAYAQRKEFLNAQKIAEERGLLDPPAEAAAEASCAHLLAAEPGHRE